MKNWTAHLTLTAILASVGGLAHAQSSVTLYGWLDTSVDAVSNVNGQRLYQVASGVQSPNKWGLRGVEDLGGGTATIFNLGSFFSTANGGLVLPGRIFGNYAWVGLTNDQAGTVKVGRQMDSVFDYLAEFSAGGSWGGSLFAHPYDNDNLWGTFIVNNVIKYQSISYSGLQFGGMYGFSNKAAASSDSSSGSSSGFADNRIWALGASYTAGAAKVGIDYEQLSNPGDDAPGSLGAVDVADVNFTSTKQRIFGIGASYSFASVDLAAIITRTTLATPTSEWENPNFTGASSLSFNNYEANAVYHATAALALKGAYTYTTADMSGASAHWNQFGLIAEYSLSKRTSLYAEGVAQRVSGGGAQFSKAEINNLALASGDSQTVLAIGMKHRF